MNVYGRKFYKATVKTNNSVKHYIGATEGPIKQRIYNHKLSFKNWNYVSNTFLSSYIWQVKDTNVSPTITWEILKQAPAYNKIFKKYLLSRHEKLAIITYPSQDTLLNKNLKSFQNVGTKTNTSLTLLSIHITHLTPQVYIKKKQTKIPWSTVSTILLYQPSHPPHYIFIPSFSITPYSYPHASTIC